MKEIIVTIGTDGKTKVETRGFKGASCLKETEALEAALGVKKGVRLTAEWNQKEQQKVGQR